MHAFYCNFRSIGEVSKKIISYVKQVLEFPQVENMYKTVCVLYYFLHNIFHLHFEPIKVLILII